MTQVLRLSAEETFAEELAALAKTDTRARPPNWKLSPQAVVVAGLESHVCVFQTVREIVRRGIEVHVVADAVASRSDENRLLGMALCERVGGFATPTETVVFDWLERAGTEEFKALSKLLR